MRHLYRIVGFILFLLVLGFALKNAQPITLQYYLGLQWQTPLVMALFLAFCAGVVAGILACLSLVVSHRRQQLALQKELKKLQSAIH